MPPDIRFSLKSTVRSTTPRIEIRKLDPIDQEAIQEIASWYFNEWNTPMKKTVSRLSAQPDSDTLFQMNLFLDGRLAATGGLCEDVNIIVEHRHLAKYSPWIALLYTDHDFRRQGLGQMLLEEMEAEAKKQGVREIYLATFTAESLYTKCGWQGIDHVRYKNHDTVVMKKEIG